MASEISLIARFGGKDLKRFQHLPVLAQWRWSPEDWHRLARASPHSLKGAMPKRVAMLAFGFASAVMVLRWLFFLNKPSFQSANLGEEFAIFLLISFFMVALMAAVTYMRSSESLYPRLGDEPVCVVTPEAIRIGDQIFWFRSNRGPLIRIEAAAHPVWGQTLVLTRRYYVSPESPLDIPVVVPIPRDRPGLATQLAELIATGLDVEASDDTARRTTGRKFKVREPGWQRRLTAILAIAASVYFGHLTIDEYQIWREGAVTQARLVKKGTSDLGHGTIYDLTYSFKTGQGESVTALGHTEEQYYSALNPGDSFPVRYVERNPALSEPWMGQNTWRIWVLLPSFLLLSALTIRMIRGTT